jgi:hypothetical protein
MSPGADTVVRSDDKSWSICGAERAQPLATAGKRISDARCLTTCYFLLLLASICGGSSMVRRGLRFESGRGLCKSAASQRFRFRIHLHYFQRAPGMEPFMEIPGPEGAHRCGGGLPKTASRAALSSALYPPETELDVVMDECSVATSTWSPSIARTVFERPLIVPGSRPWHVGNGCAGSTRRRTPRHAGDASKWASRNSDPANDDPAASILRHAPIQTSRRTANS